MALKIARLRWLSKFQRLKHLRMCLDNTKSSFKPSWPAT